MSEYKVQVVRIAKCGKHPNADSLSITQVNGAYPVIFKTGAFQEGDLAVHIPPDALVPVDRSAFSWLADKATNGVHRVCFAKIRKVPSFGFLVPLSDLPPYRNESLCEGDDMAELLGVTKFDPGPCYQLGGELGGDFFTLPEGQTIPHYDIEGLRKHENLFAPGEEVVITEKIHGSNGRWLYINDRLVCGSRTKFRTNSVWNKMAEKYDLEKILKAHPGFVLFGEVYSKGVQDLTYSADEQCVSFFDIYDTKTGKWIAWNDFAFFCVSNGLPMVPVLFQGPFDLKQAYDLAEGKTVLGQGVHVREGVVIKPKEERWDHIGRVFLKLPGEGYLLRKSAA